MTERLFRTMCEEDRDGVARVGYASWVADRHYPEWLDPAVQNRVKAWLERFVQDPGCDVVVCVIDGEVVGWGAREALSSDGNREAPQDYVSDLWIDPTRQGQGIGTALLTLLLDRMREEGLKQARIEVAQANLRALDLYLRQGFRETWRGVRMSETLGLPLPRVLLQRPL